MQEALPEVSQAARVLVGDLITTTLSAAGKQFSERRRTSAEIKAYADAMADMFCAYLRGRGKSRVPSVAQRSGRRSSKSCGA